MKILVLTIRLHGEEDDIYVFDNREVNVLPTIKEWLKENDEWLKENDEYLDLPAYVTDSESFWKWYRNEDDIDHIFIGTHYKELLSE